MKGVLAAVLLVLVFLAGTAYGPRAGAQSPKPSPPLEVGDRIVLYGEGGQGNECQIRAIRGDWLDCGGAWRNLVSGTSFVFNPKRR